MLSRTVILCAVFAALAACDKRAPQQAGQPKCPGEFKAETWTNCFGVLKRDSGFTFAAEFRNGKPNGQGTVTGGGGTYVGQLRDGTPDGQGTMTWSGGGGSNNLNYVGEWKDGEMHGQGTRSWPGGKHVGAFKNGKENGPGTEYGADGKVVRSGNWENGEYRGQ